MRLLLHHSAHSGAGSCRHRRLRLLDRRNCRLCREQCSRDRISIFKSGSCDLDRIQDSCLDHIDIFACQCVVADAQLGLAHFIDDDRAFLTCIDSDSVKRCGKGSLDDLRTGLLIAFQLSDQIIQFICCVDIRCSAACDDAFLNCCALRSEHLPYGTSCLSFPSLSERLHG